MTDAPTERAVREALAGITLPDDTTLDMRVEAVEIGDGEVRVVLRGERPRAGAYEALRQEAERAIRALPKVRSVSIVLTAERAAPRTPEPSARRAHPRPPARRIVAVASGKGGVGKSTVAVNLAVALAAAGIVTGLLDADVHGPSLPRMLGAHRRPAVRDGLIEPARAWGLVAMSMGLLVDEEEAMIWRGPMVMGALRQLVEQVAWPEMDILVVDMPPGTGDAHLTLAQGVGLDGAIIVSTPQDVALIDARRGVRMFAKVRVPILGIVENMSFFRCPRCGERHDIFGHGGARAEAARLGVPFLAEIPILPAIRSHADAGTPIVAADPEGEAATIYATIAGAVRAMVTDKLGNA